MWKKEISVRKNYLVLSWMCVMSMLIWNFAEIVAWQVPINEYVLVRIPEYWNAMVFFLFWMGLIFWSPFVWFQLQHWIWPSLYKWEQNGWKWITRGLLIAYYGIIVGNYSEIMDWIIWFQLENLEDVLYNTKVNVSYDYLDVLRISKKAGVFLLLLLIVFVLIGIGCSVPKIKENNESLWLSRQGSRVLWVFVVCVFPMGDFPYWILLLFFITCTEMLIFFSLWYKGYKKKLVSLKARRF